MVIKAHFMSNSKKNYFYSLTNQLPLLLGLISGIYFIVFNIIGKDFSMLPGDLGDGRFNNYLLEHDYKFFTGRLNDSYWDAPFMYPAKNVITYSDNLLGSAPIYSIFRCVGFDIETSFQIWFLMVLVLNYLCCYFFLKWLLKDRYASASGAFIFAFSLAIQSQMTHVQVFPKFAIPLIIWMMLLFAGEFKSKYFFLALVFLVFQFYCGIYLGFLTLIPFTILLFLIILNKWEKFKGVLKNRNWKLQIISASIFNFIMLFLLMWPYIKHSGGLGKHNTYSGIVKTIPTLKSFVYSQNGSLFWNWLSKTGDKMPAFWDHQIFAGGIATLSFILLIVTLLFNKNLFKNLNIKLLSLTAIFTFLIYIRFGNLSFFWFFFHLPGFSILRSVTRIINVELIFFAFSTALIVQKIITKFIKFKFIVFISIIVVMTLDNYMSYSSIYHISKEDSYNRLNELSEKIKTIPKGKIISYEPEDSGDQPVYYQVDAMLVSQRLGLKTVNGYSGNSPFGYTPFWFEPNTANRLSYFEKQGFQSDTIYVIYKEKPIFVENKNNKYQLHSLSMKNKIKKERLDSMINVIKSNPEWLKLIINKANQHQLPIDTMLILDAKWMLNQTK